MLIGNVEGEEVLLLEEPDPFKREINKIPTRFKFYFFAGAMVQPPFYKKD